MYLVPPWEWWEYYRQQCGIAEYESWNWIACEAEYRSWGVA